MSNVCFVDVETSGLDPDRHEIWEVGLITPDGAEYHWFLSIDETKADSFALSIGRYHERHPRGRLSQGASENTSSQLYVAGAVARLTHGLHLAGAVVSFDEERLRKLLLRNGYLPGWHYHLVDVEALAAGRLGYPPPWDSEELSRDVGVEPAEFARHTAIGDARWARALYDAVIERSL